MNLPARWFASHLFVSAGKKSLAVWCDRCDSTTLVCPAIAVSMSRRASLIGGGPGWGDSNWMYHRWGSSPTRYFMTYGPAVDTCAFTSGWARRATRCARDSVWRGTRWGVTRLPKKSTTMTLCIAYLNTTPWWIVATARQWRDNNAPQERGDAAQHGLPVPPPSLLARSLRKLRSLPSTV